MRLEFAEINSLTGQKSKQFLRIWKLGTLAFNFFWILIISCFFLSHAPCCSSFFKLVHFQVKITYFISNLPLVATLTRPAPKRPTIHNQISAPMLMKFATLFVYAHPSLHPLSFELIQFRCKLQYKHRHTSLRWPTVPWSLF